MITSIDNYNRAEGSVSEASKTSAVNARLVIKQLDSGNHLVIALGGASLEKV